MSENDLDLLYQRATGHDQARPSAAVRRAILGEARQLVAQAHTSRAVPSNLLHGFAHWLRVRWQIAAPLAAAVLAVIVLQPQLRSKLPGQARQNSAPASTRANALEPVRPQTANVTETPPIASGARSAPEPFPAERSAATPAAPRAAAPAASASNPASDAELAAPASRASGSLTRPSRSAAPQAQLRERSEAQGETARASVAPDSELLQAAARGDAARVRALVQMNAAAIDARDTRGRTALLLAVLHRHESVVRTLLEAGADPNIGDGDGRTPLVVARAQNQLPVVEALRRAGAR